MCGFSGRDEWVSVRRGEIIDRVKVRSNKNKPIWYLFKEFINGMQGSKRFSRIEMIEAIYPQKVASTLRGLQTTPDQYRRYCCLVGFIEHVGIGEYRKIADIPKELTLKVLRKHAYNEEPWQEWFIPKSIRLKTIQEIYN